MNLLDLLLLAVRHACCVIAQIGVMSPDRSHFPQPSSRSFGAPAFQWISSICGLQKQPGHRFMAYLPPKIGAQTRQLGCHRGVLARGTTGPSLGHCCQTVCVGAAWKQNGQGDLG